jgi:(p)ppGpp synthase/HD superfamily hydrolase
MGEGRHPVAAVLKALHFAADLHKDGSRKGRAKEPYVNHVIEVAELLTGIGGVTDATLLQAAILHDIVEDTPATFDDVERAFGVDVRCILEEVTDDKRLPKADRKRLQVEHAPGLSAAAKMIKVADKTSNVNAIMLSPPADWTLDRRVEYVEWSARVVAGCRGCNRALEEHYDRVLRLCREALAAEAP